MRSDPTVEKSSKQYLDLAHKLRGKRAKLRSLTQAGSKEQRSGLPEQAEAEKLAADGVRDSSAQLLQEAEARAEAAEDATAQLRATLEHQQAVFAQREDRAAREAADLQRQAAEAEARHEVRPPSLLVMLAVTTMPDSDRCGCNFSPSL